MPVPWRDPRPADPNVHQATTAQDVLKNFQGLMSNNPQNYSPPRSAWESYQIGPNAGQRVGSNQTPPPVGPMPQQGGRTPVAQGRPQSARMQNFYNGGGGENFWAGAGRGGQGNQPGRGGVGAGGGFNTQSGGGGGGGGSGGGGGGGPALDALGHGDYGPGYDSLGHVAYGSLSSGPSEEDWKKQFEMMKVMGQVDWTGSFKNWVKNGMPTAGQYTPEQMQALVAGFRTPYDFNYGQAAPAPGAPGAAPAPGSGYSYNPSYMPPQSAAGWIDPGSAASLNYWQGLAGDVNQWNADMMQFGWGADKDRFTMDQSNAALAMDWLNNQHQLDYNYWNSNLGAATDAFGYGSELYGNLDRNAAEAWYNAYGADANLYGNMYGTNINAMNDWYTQQQRNLVDKEIATMQAFGRDQLPNTRFMQNWT